jgi:glutathionylspermidine synthase
MTNDLIAEINKRFKKSIEKEPSVLRCIVTGRERPTNSEYLEEKAKKAGSKEEFIAHYICREALTLLKKGKTVFDARADLNVSTSVPPPSEATVKRALELNGK